MRYRRNKKKNNKILPIFIILLLSITVGYAILQSPLSITGTSSIPANRWDIHWNNVVINNESTATATTAAIINPNNNTKTSFEITLNNPGDFYEFTVDAVNAGSIDGMISAITPKYYAADGVTETTLPDYLTFTVTYRDGVTVATNHLLEAGATERYKLRVTYSRDIEVEDLPQTAVTIIFDYAINYMQANENAVIRERNNMIYAFNSLVNQNALITSLGTTSMNYQDIINISGENFFLRHAMTDQDRIQSSGVGYVIGGNAYYLVGGDNGTSFETNKATLLSSFGSGNCTIEAHYVYCAAGGMDADTNYDGTVSASSSNHMCTVHADKSSECLAT